MKHNIARTTTALAAALALGASLAACSTSSEPETVEEVSNVEQVEDETQESVAEEVTENDTAADAEEEAEPAADGEWATVATLTGSADQQSDTIVLSGGKVRITYDFVDNTGYDAIVGAVYLLTEGTDITTDGGIPDVMVSEAGAGETILRKSEGEYYLKVTSANADYTVTVEEQQ